MIVCVCNRVSERDIERAVDGGCASFERLQRELRVATCCGRCRDCAQHTYQRARDELRIDADVGACAAVAA